VVAADGRGSRLRELAGIDVTTIRYGQKALVFQVSHEMPHEHISTEVHRSGGPFTLVPLAGDDQRASAVVWMIPIRQRVDRAAAGFDRRGCPCSPAYWRSRAEHVAGGHRCAARSHERGG